MLNADGGAGERTSIDLADLAPRVRHEVTNAAGTEDTLTPVTPVITFTREELWRKKESIRIAFVASAIAR